MYESRRLLCIRAPTLSSVPIPVAVSISRQWQPVLWAAGTTKAVAFTPPAADRSSASLPGLRQKLLHPDLQHPLLDPHHQRAETPETGSEQYKRAEADRSTVEHDLPAGAEPHQPSVPLGSGVDGCGHLAGHPR